MKETIFVKRNAARWKSYEVEPSEHPDILTARFIALTDDLSYARTFYPDAAIVNYLNGLTAQTHRALYSNRKEDAGRLKTFWLSELPYEFYQARRYLLYAFLFFAAALVIGMVSAANDETFVRLILGDAYVDKTLENIRQGDPLAVYKSAGPADMFFAITLNNIRVAFLCFAFGLCFSAGTLFVILQNGIMLGAFQYFFYQKDLLLASVLKIWIHGTLEISAIIIAGAAGLVVGNSLLFPGTYSRLESFKRGAKRGLKMVIGLVPVFVVAGFLESFVTRLTLPAAVSAAIILLSAAFVLWYFVLYPRNRFGPY